MSITEEESKRKSNRLRADFFEVSVAIGLCSYYKIKNARLLSEFKVLAKALENSTGGKLELETQKERSRLAVSKIINELDQRLLGREKVIEINWTGRGWQTQKSLSDVDVVFNSGKLIGISLKSTRFGKGTQKNIGTDKLKFYLGLDLTEEINAMWNNIRSEFKEHGGELAKLISAGKTEIRENKYRVPAIQEIGKKYGRAVQKSATEKSVKLYNDLPQNKKLAFLDFIFGANEAKLLLNVLVEGQRISIGWNSSPYSSNDNIKAIPDKSGSLKGYHICVGGKPIIRIQANFTNGIGLSAFCERAFLS